MSGTNARRKAREALHRKDGRRIIDPPCELGHTSQAMECPSCSERVTGEPSCPEWWAWYRQRYGKKVAS